jgi:hypothetical protein
MPKRKKILFLTGSLNQTIQMHKIASHLTFDYDCYFSQVFDDGMAVNLLIKSGLVENTVISDTYREKAENYYKHHGLQSDYRGEMLGNIYDLVVMCSDMIFPKKFKNTKTIFVQEGMTDPMTIWSKIVLSMGLPGYYAMSTALNGASNQCDIYCVASQGYKDKFTGGGTDESKIIVTGMPNFDDMHSYFNNHFPYKNYVLAATSDIRELYGFDNRKKFIKNCIKIAAGRQLIFKLHPNELKERAVSEIKKYAPANSIIFTDGNAYHMVANCNVLITQYSTLSYVGLELGKEVHSYFDIDELKSLAPLQNKGTSAKKIAIICRAYIEYTKQDKKYFTDNFPGLNKQHTEIAWAS